RWPKHPIASIALDEAEINKSIRIANPHQAVYATVEIYLNAIRQAVRQSDVRPDFWYVVIPEAVYTYGRPKSQVPKKERTPTKNRMTEARAKTLQYQPSLLQEDYSDAEVFRYERNFHHQLKARLLEDQVVAQV